MDITVSTSVTGGFVLGMSSTQVTPAWTAASVPVPKVSLSVMPGSLKWTWGSMNPGSMMRLVPMSMRSSPPLTRLPAVTMRPSVIPTSVYLSSPSIRALPVMTFSMSISLTLSDIAARRRLPVYLPAEGAYPDARAGPGVRRQAGLHAEVRQVLLRVPAPLDRHLRQQQPAAAHELDDQAVAPHLDAPEVVLRGRGGDLLRDRENRDLHGDPSQLVPAQVREPGVVAGGAGRLDDGPAQRQDGHRVAYASPQFMGREQAQRDERSRRLREPAVAGDRGHGGAPRLGFHRRPGQAHGVGPEHGITPRRRRPLSRWALRARR